MENGLTSKRFQTCDNKADNMKILVADDDFLSRNALMFLLKKYGEVDGAVNGVESLDAFDVALRDGAGYDMVFLDIMMPEMDGMEAARKMRGLEKAYGVPPRNEAKIIMASGLSDPRTVFKALNRSEATDFLVKPCEASSVRETLCRTGAII